MPVGPAGGVEVVTKSNHVLTKDVVVERLSLKCRVEGETQNVEEPLRKGCGQGASISFSPRLHGATSREKSRGAPTLAKEVGSVSWLKHAGSKARSESNTHAKEKFLEEGPLSRKSKGGVELNKAAALQSQRAAAVTRGNWKTKETPKSNLAGSCTGGAGEEEESQPVCGTPREAAKAGELARICKLMERGATRSPAFLIPSRVVGWVQPGRCKVKRRVKSTGTKNGCCTAKGRSKKPGTGPSLAVGPEHDAGVSKQAEAQVPPANGEVLVELQGGDGLKNVDVLPPPPSPGTVDLPT